MSIYASAAELLDPTDGWKPEAHQIAPGGKWRYWLLLAGRGSGKTDAGAAYIDEQCKRHKIRGRIIAPTQGDALESAVEGISGIKAHNPAVQIKTGRHVEVLWPNGSRMRLFGAHTREDVERLRAGGNSELDWYEELAAWRYLDKCWEQADLGLRIGDRPHAVITTTPKPRLVIKALAKMGSQGIGEVALTQATTNDNPHLAGHIRQRLLDLYGGTRIGRQELYAEVLEDIEGAIWKIEEIEERRIDAAEAPGMRRIVVAVDPSWGTTNDECGIVVAGVGFDRRGYILDDASMMGPPGAWGARVKAAYENWKADRIVAEANFQAEQVKLVMRTTDPMLQFKQLHATRGKKLRAEPVHALYEQGKISHVGRFPNLEQQMTEWVEEESDFSPDRLDAMVWAITELMLTNAGPAKLSSAHQRQLPGPRRELR